jgi:hypothetical protein
MASIGAIPLLMKKRERGRNVTGLIHDDGASAEIVMATREKPPVPIAHCRGGHL